MGEIKVSGIQGIWSFSIYYPFDVRDGGRGTFIYVLKSLIGLSRPWRSSAQNEKRSKSIPFNVFFEYNNSSSSYEKCFSVCVCLRFGIRERIWNFKHLFTPPPIPDVLCHRKPVSVSQYWLKQIWTNIRTSDKRSGNWILLRYYPQSSQHQLRALSDFRYTSI